ncbi:MAG: DinB family protein [Ignavibacteriaceae bacterium]
MSQSQINLLKWMLEDVRKITLRGVAHLTKEQLFQIPAAGEYPIGAYLMHLAEVDLGWLETLSGKQQSEDLIKKSYGDKWFDPSGESSPPKEALEINEYIDTIAEARKNFLDYVSTLGDSELEGEVILKRKDGDHKIKKKWIIYHIIEHEAHHRGQMFMLIRKAGWNKVKS